MYHKLILVGRLGRDPELRYLPSGQAVADFSMACSRTYNDSQGERQEETLWVRVSVWGARAETVNQYLKKGARVLVEGMLRPDENGNPRIWTRSDGTPGVNYEMTAYNVTFLETRAEAEGREQVLPAPEMAEDDIPF